MVTLASHSAPPQFQSSSGLFGLKCALFLCLVLCTHRSISMRHASRSQAVPRVRNALGRWLLRRRRRRHRGLVPTRRPRLSKCNTIQYNTIHTCIKTHTHSNPVAAARAVYHTQSSVSQLQSNGTARCRQPSQHSVVVASSATVSLPHTHVYR